MEFFKNDFLILVFFTIITVVQVNQVSCNCRYRDLYDLPRDVFSYWASWGCYIFTRFDLFVKEPLFGSICEMKSGNRTFSYIGLKSQNNCVPFHYLNEEVAMRVKQTFRNKLTFEKWNECSLDAMTCCDDLMMKDEIKDGYCPSVWDGWSCFKSIPIRQTYEQICPKYAYAKEPPRSSFYSYKYCKPTGNWSLRTDYSSCDITPSLLVRIQYQMSLLTISLIICTPAIIILIWDEQLHTQKLNLIRNFLTAIFIRNFIIILVKSTIIIDEVTNIDETVMDRNQWSCKLLSFLEILAGNIVFTFMLLEGIYLHQLLTNVFRSRQSNGPKMSIFYICGGLISLSSAIVWAIIMAIYNDFFCWQYSEKYFPHWIYDTPRLLMLLINVILLIHIIVRLWSTLRNNENENRPHIRTVKAALVCSPLFGIPFFFTLLRPNSESIHLEQFYYMFYYTIEASQGILIAVLHCYREKKVKKKLKAIFLKIKSYVSEKSYWTRRSGSLTDSDTRRATISSFESPAAQDILEVPKKQILKIKQSSEFEIEISANETTNPLKSYILNPNEILKKKGKEHESNYSDDDDDRIYKVKQVQFQNIH